ncbi:unnamed protein product [Calypogeia fissa]
MASTTNSLTQPEEVPFTGEILECFEFLAIESQLELAIGEGFKLQTRAIQFHEEDVEVSLVEADPLIEWTIEFAKYLEDGTKESEKQTLCVKMNGRDSRFKTVGAGHVVDVTMAQTKFVNVVVENTLHHKWY